MSDITAGPLSEGDAFAAFPRKYASARHAMPPAFFRSQSPYSPAAGSRLATSASTHFYRIGGFAPSSGHWRPLVVLQLTPGLGNEPAERWVDIVGVAEVEPVVDHKRPVGRHRQMMMGSRHGCAPVGRSVDGMTLICGYLSLMAPESASTIHPARNRHMRWFRFIPCSRNWTRYGSGFGAELARPALARLRPSDIARKRCERRSRMADAWS